jgi:hypothetical protein
MARQALTTAHDQPDHEDLATAAPFPGAQRPVLAAAMKSCPRCGIESTEELCFNCQTPLVDRATYDWLQSPNPSRSEC